MKSYLTVIYCLHGHHFGLTGFIGTVMCGRKQRILNDDVNFCLKQFTRGKKTFLVYTTGHVKETNKINSANEISFATYELN